MTGHGDFMSLIPALRREAGFLGVQGQLGLCSDLVFMFVLSLSLSPSLGLLSRDRNFL